MRAFPTLQTWLLPLPVHITRLKFQALLFSFSKDSHSNYSVRHYLHEQALLHHDVILLWLGMIPRTAELLLTCLFRYIMLQGTDYPRDAHESVFNQFPSSMNNHCYE